MTSVRLMGGLILLLSILLGLGVAFGETQLSLAQYHQAFTDAGSAPGEVLWGLRAPRVVAAAATRGARRPQSTSPGAEPASVKA